MSLIRLSEDRTLKVAPNEPQLQDFGFYSDTGDKLGSIKDLIADTDTMKVRFLIASWHEGFLERKDVIIPIRDVMIDMDAKRVICNDCTTERLNSYPEYKGGILPDLTKRFAATFLPNRAKKTTTVDKDIVGTREPIAKHAFTDETVINDELGVTSAAELREERQRVAEDVRAHEAKTEQPITAAEVTTGRDINEARMDVVEEKLQVGKRDIKTGEAVIRKTVAEEKVCEPVELRQERVEIERRAVNRPSDRAPGQGEMEVHVPLMGQEVVTNKQVFVREEILLHKVADVDRRDVCDTVRHEEVDTSGLGTKAKTDVGAEPVSKTDIAGDKIDLKPPQGRNEELGRPDHLFDEPRDRPLI